MRWAVRYTLAALLAADGQVGVHSHSRLPVHNFLRFLQLSIIHITFPRFRHILLGETITLPTIPVFHISFFLSALYCKGKQQQHH